MIKYDFYTYTNIKKEDVVQYEEKIQEIKKIMEKKEAMLDWMDVESTIKEEEIKDILSTSKEIRKKADVFLVIGIGGSYLGAYSFIKAFSSYFEKENCEVLFAGYSLSSFYLKDLFHYLKDKDVVVNFISKSGGTLEPNLVFDQVLSFLQEKYEDITDRVIITTDKESKLMQYAKDHKFKTYEVPRNIGGRYSVFTTVGLLPISVAGIDIQEILKGLKDGKEEIEKAYEYASIRDILYKNGKKVESFGVYEEKLLPFTEWLKQLFGETQGKDGKGLLPTSTLNTRDLHSLGQFYQEGSKILFETNIKIEETKKIEIEKYHLTLDSLNSKAVSNVALAHKNGGVYSNIITLDKLTVYDLTKLMYFFMVSAAVGGYLLKVNPFDQPGVEEYKKLLKESIGQ